MFGLFRKKTDMQRRIEARINLIPSLQDKDPTTYAKASNTIWPFLLKTILLQLKMTEENEGIFAKNSFCLGYLLGATESMIQRLGYPDNARAVIVPEVLIPFFDPAQSKTGEAFFHKAISLQGDPQFERGRTIGGNEYYQLAINTSSESSPPLGLFQYIQSQHGGKHAVQSGA